MSQARVIVNPLSGEQIMIRRTAAETGGAVLDWELLVAPGGKVPSSHAHPKQTETFTVLEGRMKFRVGWRRVIAAVGQSVRIPPGTVHHFANAARRRPASRWSHGPVAPRREQCHSDDMGFFESIPQPRHLSGIAGR